MTLWENSIKEPPPHKLKLFSYESNPDGPGEDEAIINSSPQNETSKTVQGSTLCVNDRCELLDWKGTSSIVARGKISVIDPTTKVHGYMLGLDCYRVLLKK